MHFIINYHTADIVGGVTSVSVVILDDDHFSAPVATVYKTSSMATGVWCPAMINYGGCDHKSSSDQNTAILAKAEALVRAVEIAEELDKLWPGVVEIP